MSDIEKACKEWSEDFDVWCSHLTPEGSIELLTEFVRSQVEKHGDRWATHGDIDAACKKHQERIAALEAENTALRDERTACQKMLHDIGERLTLKEAELKVMSVALESGNNQLQEQSRQIHALEAALRCADELAKRIDRIEEDLGTGMRKAQDAYSAARARTKEQKP